MTVNQAEWFLTQVAEKPKALLSSVEMIKKDLRFWFQVFLFRYTHEPLGECVYQNIKYKSRVGYSTVFLPKELHN